MEVEQQNCPSAGEQGYASYIKDLARKTVRSKRERMLAETLGTIKAVVVLNFVEFVFTLRVTTNTAIYRITVGMNRLNLASDVASYDPWSLKWFPHASRLESIILIKGCVDGGDLYGAEVVNAMRKLHLQETEESHRQSAAALNKLFAEEEDQMEEEEEKTFLPFPAIAHGA